jgi:hypothetical protein
LTGKNVKGDRQEGTEKKKLTMILGTVLAADAALEIVMIRKRKIACCSEASCVTHGMNSDVWNANENMFITQ